MLPFRTFLTVCGGLLARRMLTTALLLLSVLLARSCRTKPVAFVGKEQKDEDVKNRVECGGYSLVFMSPEVMLTVLKWHEMFHTDVYQECMICLAVDEAHCIRILF